MCAQTWFLQNNLIRADQQTTAQGCAQVLHLIERKGMRARAARWHQLARNLLHLHWSAVWGARQRAQRRRFVHDVVWVLGPALASMLVPAWPCTLHTCCVEQILLLRFRWNTWSCTCWLWETVGMHHMLHGCMNSKSIQHSFGKHFEGPMEPALHTGCSIGLGML